MNWKIISYHLFFWATLALVAGALLWLFAQPGSSVELQMSTDCLTGITSACYAQRSAETAQALGQRRAVIAFGIGGVLLILGIMIAAASKPTNSPPN